MNHADLTLIHIMENWVFPNATARLATGAYMTSDLGKIGYQQDVGSYWRLTGTAPTWQSIQAPFMTAQATPVNPSGITSTVGVMAGFGVYFTPQRTGNVLIMATGSASNNTASDGSMVQLRSAGGAPPGFNTALTGTIVGHSVTVQNSTAAAVRIGFSLQGILTGLGIGVQNWVDLALTAITGGTVNVYDVTIVIVEL